MNEMIVCVQEDEHDDKVPTTKSTPKSKTKQGGEHDANEDDDKHKVPTTGHYQVYKAAPKSNPKLHGDSEDNDSDTGSKPNDPKV